jgi:aspartate/methionine/tyrosine aminotransferase
MMRPSQRAAAIRPSPIRQLFDARRPTSINLGLGEPGMPVPMELLDKGVARYRAKRVGYTPNAGITELRQLIADRHALPHARAAKNVIVTVGLQEALFATLLAIADPGDEILICDPAFLAYRTVAELLGLTVRAVPLSRESGFALDGAALAAAVGDRTRAILLNSPANPTGRVDSARELRALAEGTEGLGVFLISDEVYGELYYGDRPPSIGAMSERSIVLGALSKTCSMTGFRLGWVIAPDTVAGAIAAVHQFNVTCAPTISQHLALEAFERPEWLASLRPDFARRREIMLRALEPLGLPMVPCEGGFFVFLDVSSRSRDSFALARRLLDEADVVTVPGVAFGAGGEGFLRLSFAGNEADLAEGVARLATLLTGA